jgi:hypothetical protein
MSDITGFGYILRVTERAKRFQTPRDYADGHNSALCHTVRYLTMRLRIHDSQQASENGRYEAKA